MNEICQNVCPCNQCNTEQEDCELAKAYARNIPVKPIYITTTISGYNECPVCGNVVINKFCDRCGKALDRT